MTDSRQNQVAPGLWRFRREITLGTIVHLAALGLMMVTAWSNLQQELALIRRDLTQLVSSNAKLSEHMENVTRACQKQELRLKMLERQVNGRKVTHEQQKECVESGGTRIGVGLGRIIGGRTDGM